jgi:hypothetical protein
LRFLKNTFASAGISGSEDVVAIFMEACEVSALTTVESVLVVSLLLPELQDIRPIIRIAGMPRNFFIFFNLKGYIIHLR